MDSNWYSEIHSSAYKFFPSKATDQRYAWVGEKRCMINVGKCSAPRWRNNDSKCKWYTWGVSSCADVLLVWIYFLESDCWDYRKLAKTKKGYGRKTLCVMTLNSKETYPAIVLSSGLEKSMSCTLWPSLVVLSERMLWLMKSIS